jgi:DNA-binding FrmR family transcriptional regulator
MLRFLRTYKPYLCFLTYLVHMAEKNVMNRLESIEGELREIGNRLEEMDRHLLSVLMWLEQIAKAKMS